MLIEVAIQLRSVRRNCTSTQVTVMKAMPINAMMPSMRVSGPSRAGRVPGACLTGLVIRGTFIAWQSAQARCCRNFHCSRLRFSVRRGDAVRDLLLQRARVGRLQVGLRDDAAQLAVLVHDRHPADAVRGHRLRAILQRVAFLAGDRGFGHAVAAVTAVGSRPEATVRTTMSRSVTTPTSFL